MAPRGQKRKAKVAINKDITNEMPDKNIPDRPATDTEFNPRTGRPIRKGAGRKSLNEGYVNPTEAMSDEDEDEFIDDEDDNIRVAKKRKRSPTPPMTPRRLIDDAEMPEDIVPSYETDISPVPMVKAPPVSLTFNVPAGHSGPFVVNLDINSLMGLSQTMLANSISPSRSCTRSSDDSGYASKSRDTSEPPKIRSSPRKSNESGFLSLPPELRNEIYRLVFAKQEKLDFGHPKNFSRSSHFLRTCKQIHEEGKSILYTENTFYFQASRETRTRRFESGAYQIGYKDIRYFLSVIGGINLGLIRNMIFVFEDLVPSLNLRMKSIDERRFTNNEDLYAVLRLLGDYSRLQTLKVSFQGRRWFFEGDETRFASYLTRIKADDVEFVTWPEHVYNAESKSPKSTEQDLKKEMQRPTPIFGTKDAAL